MKRLNRLYDCTRWGAEILLGSPLFRWAALVAGISFTVTMVLLPSVLSFHFCVVLAPFAAMACGSTSVDLALWARRHGWALSRLVRAFTGRVSLLLLVPVTVAFSVGAVEGFCDLWQDLCYYALGPGFSGLLAGCVGLGLGLRIRRGRRVSHALFMAFFVATFGLDLWGFFARPQVFFYSPFLGFFPGPIYETRIEVRSAYLWFRLDCLLGGLAVASWGIAGHFKRRMAKHLTWVSAACFAFLWYQGETLGFRTSTKSLITALPVTESGACCVLHHSRKVSSEWSEPLLRDCEFRCAQAMSFFGTHEAPRVNVFLYDGPDQKSRLVGAGYTDVAKPWLRQVHLDISGPGDPVLLHELGHVVAGSLADNPLALPLSYGVLPSMGIVEGLAVSLTDAQSGPSSHEWVAGMLAAGMDPDPVRMLSPLAFETTKGARAYSVAGSFVDFVYRTYGRKAVARLAKGDEVQEVLGLPSEELRRRWEAFVLRRVGLVRACRMARRSAQVMSGPGVLGQRCVVEGSKLLARFRQAMAAGEFALARDMAFAYYESTSDEWALGTVARLDAVSDSLDRHLLDSLFVTGTKELRLAVADAWALERLRTGEPMPSKTRGLLLELLKALQPGPFRRSVEARLAMWDESPRAALAVFLLLGGLSQDPEGDLWLALLSAPTSWATHYLAARWFYTHGSLREALDHALSALALGVPGRDVESQALVVAIRSAHFLGHDRLCLRFLARLRSRAIHLGQQALAREYEIRCQASGSQ